MLASLVDEARGELLRARSGNTQSLTFDSGHTVSGKRSFASRIFAGVRQPMQAESPARAGEYAPRAKLLRWIAALPAVEADADEAVAKRQRFLECCENDLLRQVAQVRSPTRSHSKKGGPGFAGQVLEFSLDCADQWTRGPTGAAIV